MKFNLKLFVLVGIFVGLCDVWGTEENEDDGFIVAELKNNDGLKAAVKGMRVINAVYETQLNGVFGIIDIGFQDKLSSILVLGGEKVEEVKAGNCTIIGHNLCYNMQKKVEYTVYFIFKEECFEGTEDNLLLSTAWMFEGCQNLIRADLRFFNTTNVTYMFSMFRGCTALKDLNLSNFNTKKVTNMSDMFYNCSSLTKLDLSKFDTKNVTDMSKMFTGWTSCQQVFLPSTCAGKKKKCICCGDEYVRWNNHEVGGLNPKIVQFKDPKEIIGNISTGK